MTFRKRQSYKDNKRAEVARDWAREGRRAKKVEYQEFLGSEAIILI